MSDTGENSIIHVADAAWLQRRGGTAVSGLGPVTAWYFGNTYGSFRALQQALPDTVTWGDTGRRLSAIFQRHHDAIINLSEAFDIYDWAWWETRNIAERGPYATTFPIECCRAVLFGELLRDAGRHLVITENSDLAKVLLGLPRNGPSVRRLGGTAGGCRRAMQSLAAGLRFVKAVGRRARQIRRLKQLRRTNPVPTQQLAECDVLIAAWTAPGDFSPTQTRAIAHSLGRLPAVLAEDGRKTGYIALPLTWTSDADAIMRDVATAKDPVLHIDDAVGYLDLFRAALAAIGFKARPKPGFTLGGAPTAAIAAMVLRRERFDWRAVNARLFALAARRLAAIGARPKAIFHVYENQSWEKGLRSGFHTALPETRIVGCLQSPLSLLYANIFPSRAEITDGRLPDMIIALGRHTVRMLVDGGCPTDRLIAGGLLRSGAFLLAAPEGGAAAGEGPVLVCTTGPDYDEACELALKSALAVAATPGSKLYVNFHPLSPDGFRVGVRRFLERAGVAGQNVEFTDRPIKDLVAHGIDAAIYGDTNAAFEVLSSGGKAINVNRDLTMSFDKVPRGLSRRVTTVDELIEAVVDMKSADRWAAEKTVAKSLDDCFSEIDKLAVTGTIGGHLPPRPAYEKAP